MATGKNNTGRMRRAALAAMVAASLFVPAAWAGWQRNNTPAARPAPAPAARPYRQPPQNTRPRAGGPQPNVPRYQGRPDQQFQGRAPGGPVQRPVPGYSGYPDSGYPNSGYGRPPYPGNTGPGSAYRPAPFAAPARPYAYPGAAPPGHLGDWLNEHHNLPPQDKERVLRSDPNFNRLPAQDQARLLNRLNQVNQMPEEQRQRTLARGEIIEHLSPQDRMQVNLSARRFASMPPDRQALMTGAFRDLRGVPPDQRGMVLNSSRYQGAFTPDERRVLSDMLRVEPYEPAR